MAICHPWPIGCGTADSAGVLGGRRIRRRLVEWQYAIHGLSAALESSTASARGWPYHGRRPRRQAKPGGRKRRRRGESGGHGWPTRTSGDVVRSIPSPERAGSTRNRPQSRSERPATWYGQSQARKGQAVLETGLSPDANVRRRGTVNPKPGKGRQYSKPASVPTRTSGDVVRSIPSPARASTTSHRSSRPARHGNHCCGVVLAVTGSRGSNWNIMS